jgi:hypothetical protein
LLKDTKPSTRLIAARVLKFDARKGVGTVVTSDGKRIVLGWEHLKHVAPLLDIDAVVFLVTSDNGEMLRIRLASNEGTR